MINEHDMTKKMLNLIREAAGDMQPMDNQASNELSNPNSEGGPVNNIAISGELPSGVQFTMNYKENLGITIIAPELTKLEIEMIQDLSQLLGLQKTFRQKWNERGGNTNLGKKQIVIFRLNDGQQEFGPDNSKAWFDEDVTMFAPVSDDITFTSYIINP